MWGGHETTVAVCSCYTSVCSDSIAVSHDSHVVAMYLPSLSTFRFSHSDWFTFTTQSQSYAGRSHEGCPQTCPINSGPVTTVCQTLPVGYQLMNFSPRRVAFLLFCFVCFFCTCNVEMYKAYPNLVQVLHYSCCRLQIQLACYSYCRRQ